MSTINYINLTNGAEAIPQLADSGEQWRFIRIQSTACEQKRWDHIIADLDYDFLMNLALGNKCVIYDFSSKKPISRAVFQGLEWIKFVINKEWFDRTVKPSIRGDDCAHYFEGEYHKLRGGLALRKLKYFKKFLNTDSLNISTVTAPTVNDNNYPYYIDIIKKFC